MNCPPGRHISQFVISRERYLELAEVYAITLVGMVLCNIDHTISWTTRADLPEEKCQGMLRKLCSLHLAKDSSSSLDSGMSREAERHDELSISDNGSIIHEEEGSPRPVMRRSHTNEKKSEPIILKSVSLSTGCLSDRAVTCFWWFRTVHMKFANGLQ